MSKICSSFQKFYNKINEGMIGFWTLENSLRSIFQGVWFYLFYQFIRRTLLVTISTIITPISVLFTPLVRIFMLRCFWWYPAGSLHLSILFRTGDFVAVTVRTTINGKIKLIKISKNKSNKLKKRAHHYGNQQELTHCI